MQISPQTILWFGLCLCVCVFHVDCSTLDVLLWVSVTRFKPFERLRFESRIVTYLRCEILFYFASLFCFAIGKQVNAQCLSAKLGQPWLTRSLISDWLLTIFSVIVCWYAFPQYEGSLNHLHKTKAKFCIISRNFPMISVIQNRMCLY